MSGDGLIWLVLVVSLLILNALAISLYKRNKIPLCLSGIVIGILGPIIGFIAGYFFVKIDHNSGGTGEGAGFGAAFIGLIIVANGIIYLIIGIISKVKSLIHQKNINQ